MTTFLDTTCKRCGSKRKISRTWKEKLPTITGTTEVEYSQIVCTNKECQTAFEENLVEENKKRDILRQKKEENELQRKNRFLAKAQKK